ncbi:hypothetical protein GCM10010317_077150 [Streptomyces mirabilis]|uniref:hypothetical protein n=1 Tax=Streptomyces mirabilis TaxID=68239 RepID=UPI00167CAB96|nr:hypothetical protein [Streptomyces mirabilis]GHD70246.1 hypothetical protein GCM10010317_077150 [Streptomyces mirabilis]
MNAITWTNKKETSVTPPYSGTVTTWDVIVNGATYSVIHSVGRYAVLTPGGVHLGLSCSEGEVEAAITAAEANAKAIKGMPTHIRQRPARKWGNGFYRPQYSSSENGSRTLCGAQPTDKDMGWGDARFAKNLGYVTCDECKGLRQS